MKENQQTVTDWGRETFGDQGREYRLRVLIEEVAELAICEAFDPVEFKRIVDVVYRRSADEWDSRENSCDEAADVLINLMALASIARFDLMVALDNKMALNRSRSKEHYADKQRTKVTQGIVPYSTTVGMGLDENGIGEGFTRHGSATRHGEVSPGIDEIDLSAEDVVCEHPFDKCVVTLHGEAVLDRSKDHITIKCNACGLDHVHPEGWPDPVLRAIAAQEEACRRNVENKSIPASARYVMWWPDLPDLPQVDLFTSSTTGESQ